MTLDFQEKVMRLARQSCELNTWEWPDDLSDEPLGFEDANVNQKHETIRAHMKEIDREIYNLTHIDPYLITNYYWNCYYRDDPNTPQEWIEWIFFDKVGDKCYKEDEYCGYIMQMKGYEA